MATTAQTVFELSMALIDEISSNGIVNGQNAQDYQGKAPRLISILEEDLCRRAGITIGTRVTSLTDTLNVTDDIAYRIMPYGLAALFLLIEDPQTSTSYNNKYEALRRQIPSAWETITDVYADGSDV